MKQIAWTKKKATIALTLCTIIAISSIMMLQNNQVSKAALVDPHPGLAGWWRFDEGSGTIAGDSSGNGNNGTIFGTPSWVPGMYGEALSFDGSSNYVAVPNSASLQTTGTITLEAWIKTNSMTKQAIITKSGSYLLYTGTGGDGKVYGYLYGTTSGWKVGTTNVADGAWHLIALTYDPSAGANNFKLYVDGNLDAQYTVTGAISASTQRVGLGDRADVGYRDFFNGAIDEAHIYSRVLSATEIQSDFQNNPDFSGNVAAKIPAGTTQVIVTLSWQGTGSINATIKSPTQTYTENAIPVYQKTTYSTNSGPLTMLNIKRLSVSVNALASDQNWNITLAYDTVSAYQISVEVQK